MSHRTLNLGILAHVDAGKTTLTERLLYAAGVIDEVGSVDDGTTQTDSLSLEQQRGITIKSAVVSFTIGDVTVNLIDTPGHPDFIAEVERVLSVLDGAVLVISAVEGVQPQTYLLMRALRRLDVPALIFVNKIDRGGAGDERVLHAISERLTPAIVPMGTARDLGGREASVRPWSPADVELSDRSMSVLAEQSEPLMAAYVNDATAISHRRLREELATQTRRARVYPVFFGSALTGVGVEALMAGIAEFLPAREGDADEHLSGRVFKIERGPTGDKIAYARLFSGSVQVRDSIRFGSDREGRVTAIRVFSDGSTEQRTTVAAGEIGKLWGLRDVQVGDAIGTPQMHAKEHHFAPPTLETVVVPGSTLDKGRLRVALAQLAEQDPLINVRQDDVRGELSISLYGEVQKEVIQATLATDYGLGVTFRETTTIHIERPVGIGEAVEPLRGGSTPFLAGVGLRIEPAPIDTGIVFRLEVELGSMPPAFFNAIEETIKTTLHQGLHGWQVADCIVTLTYSGYFPRQSHAHATFDKSMSSTAGDFRSLTPLVVMEALKEAGTMVYEPIHRFRLDVPADAVGHVLAALARFQAVPRTQAVHGGSCALEGDIPAARVHELQQQLPALTRGEGVLECIFDRYQPLTGTIPSRPRFDHDPLNREAYLLRVTRGRSPLSA